MDVEDRVKNFQDDVENLFRQHFGDVLDDTADISYILHIMWREDERTTVIQSGYATELLRDFAVDIGTIYGRLASIIWKLRKLVGER